MKLETTLVLLGFGLGALLIAKTGNAREENRPTSLNDQLRARAIEAQRTSMIAARRARELTSLWYEQEARSRDLVFTCTRGYKT